jgi:hypothetical protein
MILFEQDWLDYPGAIIHYKTRNRSALDLAAKLRIMGVKNNSFFLALIDVSLENVNPHDPNLTQEQMQRIGIECKVNPWYFFREVARAPAIAGTTPSTITFNRANIALWWSFFNHIYIILIQPRQTGKSFSTDLLMTLLMNFICNNTQINLMTKDDKLRSENVARLKNIYEELPRYLQFKTKADVNNTEELSVKAFGNTYKTHVPQASPKKAYNLGRGLTTPIVHGDETPFQPNIGIAMPAALLAMAAAEEQAKKNDEPYGVIMTTTAGKIDDKDGKYVYGIVQSSASWTERFYDAKDAEELEAIVRANGRGLYRVYAAFSYKQLGKDDAWMRQQLERAGATGDDANRDLFNMWTSGNQYAVLPTNVLETMRRSVTDPLYEQIFSIGGYIVRWYLDESELEYFLSTRKVIVGIDTSDAGGGDDLSCVFVDVETGATIGVATINETNLIKFCMWLVYMITSFENTTYIIERRSSGATIIDYLLLQLPLKGIDPTKRIFNWVVNDHLEYGSRYEEFMQPMSRRSEDTYVRSKKYFGFATSGGGQTSRSELYSTTLFEAAKIAANRMMDRVLVDQISGLVKINGRVDHVDGGHDDVVIGWLLCHWFLTKAKNLSYYGIDPRKILCDRGDHSVEKSVDEKAIDYVQQLVRNRIDELYELMQTEPNEILLERYQNELRSLDKQLILEDGETFSIDAFLEEIREKRSYLFTRQTAFSNTTMNAGYSYDNLVNEYGHLQNTRIIR